MEFLILQSKRDADFYIITDERNYHRAIQEYRESQPGDDLAQAPAGSEQQILSTIPNLSVVRSFIDLIGYFGHVVDVPKSWPTPAAKDQAQTG